ncbi:acyltransferase family protein [Chitinophaga ginsengisoli]|uniref:Peptidoglycan/LPS O-acetylase OafA/YrhL n=1 Tax=Chitinophaga ginsengisoli TaxID=363837 RepID=A0A2P8GA46_9BACT|nr:acyltransferase [Chitinophaga ginsengisoli]PSL30851.1 peptidoglycan/LPS O-acetylase OafA/YrhL [Chitinophaga ginsengisoli]
MKHDANPGSSRIVVLDSLRGLAAMIVCLHHFLFINANYLQVYKGQTWYDILFRISEYNKEAVLFFFVLSGFSIGLSLKNKAPDSPETINEYIYRRFKRILPVYILALLFTLISGFVMHQVNLPNYSAWNMLGNILFLQTADIVEGSWFIPYGFNGPLWSLSFEFFFYCFFPLVYLINRKYLGKINILVKYAVLLVLSIAAFAVNKIFFIPYFAFFSSFIIWLSGYLVSRTYLKGHTYHLLFTGVFACGVLYLTAGRHFLSSNTLAFICKGLVMAAVFYMITFFSKSETAQAIFKWPVWILNKIFNYVGKGSYATYALHYPLMLMLRYFHVNMIVQVVLILLFIILCTTIEEKTIRWKLNMLRLNYTSFFFRRFNLAS